MFIFNARCQREKKQGTIENCIKIVAWTNGSAIWQTQNNGLTFHWFYYPFLLEILSQSIAL
jgi:hypothetical protein